MDRHLGMRQQTLSHDLGCSQLIPTNKNVDVRSVLGQVHGLLGSAVTSTYNHKRLVTENGDRTVANGTGRDTTLPVRVLSWQVHTLGTGTGGNDQSLCEFGSLVLGVLAPELEWTRGKVDLGNGLGVNLGTETNGLSTELVHDFGTTDTIRETRKFSTSVVVVS